MKIRKNDDVLVIAGKDRGKKGKVRFAYPKDERVIVEGVNMIKTHARTPATQARQGGLVEREATLHVSNLMLVCNKCNKPARVGFKTVEGKKIRVCRACGEVID
jgi:large subunit ribosomal protein L24